MKTSNHSHGRANLYQVVTNQILELMEGQKLTWNKPWISVKGKPAHNAVSKRTYSGLNRILLSLRQTALGIPYNGWLTFLQIQELGGRVLPCERSSAVYYYNVTFSDKYGKRLEPEEIQALKESEISEKGLKRQFILRYYNVFNIGQTIGLPPHMYKIEEVPVFSEVQKDDKAEALIKSTDAKIIHWASDEACYSCNYRQPQDECVNLSFAHSVESG